MSETEVKKQKITPPEDTLRVYLRSDKATLPVKGSEWAAGYDIFSSAPGVIPAHGQGLIDTDLTVCVPYGTYGRIAPRSGLAVRNGILTGAGVVDADYRGEVKVLLFNHSDKDFHVEAGDRIAQLVLERIVNADIVAITAEEVDNTARGEARFGSTGVKKI